MSPLLDVFILLKTIPTVLSPVVAGVVRRGRQLIRRRELRARDPYEKKTSPFGGGSEKRNERPVQNA
jgi:hypothetical protein